MAPVNQLPPELLGEILQLSTGLYKEPKAYSGWRMVWKTSALSVCYLWRAIVLNLPALWSQIYISGTTSQEEIATWASRAGNKPLDIRLGFPRDHQDTNKKMSQKIISSWNSLETHHIHSLRIEGQIIPNTILPLRRNVAELHILIMHCYFVRIQPDAGSTFTIFPSHVPSNLQVLDVSNEFHNPISITLSSVGTQDLSRLEYLRFTEGVKLLHAGEALATCRLLKFMEIDSCDRLHGSLILLPNVERLELGPELLKSFDLPKLYTLTLHGLLEDTHHDLLRLGSLKKLIIFGFGIGNIADAVAFLTSIPQVVYLELDLLEGLEDVIQALCRVTPGVTTGTSSFLCPKLQVLECLFENNVALFKSLVEARLSSPAGSPPLEIWLGWRNHPKKKKWEPWMEKIRWASSTRGEHELHF
ncbi:hypothetical protein DL93DRAFT_108124 [Clavulina sp. PMI_390]|nr:hypothetical protein DL93DRAFT_108124 [Clavulina sp. PMI_390]